MILMATRSLVARLIASFTLSMHALVLGESSEAELEQHSVFLVDRRAQVEVLVGQLPHAVHRDYNKFGIKFVII